jgi:Tfp pilus assembly protein PilO
MRRDFKIKMRLVMLFLTLLIAADVALGVYSWNLDSAQSAQQELTRLTLNRDLLKKDIQRAKEIRSHIPAIQKDCDAFEGSFFPQSTGYSTVSGELNSLAAKSGLRLEGNAFKPKGLKGSELTELVIDTQVTGDYRGVVRFLNALQRSPNYYAVEALSARPGGQARGPKGTLQVTLHIKTYFRAA